MVQPPLGLVELGRGSGPVLMMGLEPDGPFARVLVGQQPGQPGGPGRGVLAGRPRTPRGSGITPSLLASASVPQHLRRFRYSTGQSGRDYVWLSKGISLSIKASTSSRPSATSSVSISFS